MSSKLKKANKLAQKLHKKDIRLSGETVYDHVSRVHNLLKNIGVEDEGILIGSYFHQTPISDNKIRSEIQTNFGDDVIKIIKTYQNLSDMDIPCPSEDNFNEKYIIQTYLNLAEDMRVLLIRLADKADNIKTAHALDPVQRNKVANRAMHLYAPISRLLGINQITRELENEAFKYLHPDKYFRIKKAIEEKKPELEEFFKETKDALEDLLLERGIKAEISHRIKHIYGIHKKALTISSKHHEIQIKNDYSGVYDMAAMRIIVGTEKQCYEVEDILNQFWEQIIGARDDYIQNPKPSGYQSIHNHYKTNRGIQIEVQIRTHDMHEVNEYGSASHAIYKVGSYFKDQMKENPDWLKDLYVWQKEKSFKQSEARLKQFKNNVYALTPKGDIIELDKGATAVDFAYAVHTKIGDTCSGAIVNGEIKKLNYEIQDGDRVEIQTSNRNKPSRDWLEFVKTQKAKSEIRKKTK